MYRGGGREGGREQGFMYTFARERERIGVYVYTCIYTFVREIGSKRGSMLL